MPKMKLNDPKEAFHGIIVFHHAAKLGEMSDAAFAIMSAAALTIRRLGSHANFGPCTYGPYQPEGLMPPNELTGIGVGATVPGGGAGMPVGGETGAALGARGTPEGATGTVL